MRALAHWSNILQRDLIVVVVIVVVVAVIVDDYFMPCGNFQKKDGQKDRQMDTHMRSFIELLRN